MMHVFQVIWAACLAEITQLRRTPLLVALTIIQSVTFLFLVSLFGMTGAYAPTVVVDHDKGGPAQGFIEDLRVAHHSFNIQRKYSEDEGMALLKQGRLVAIISIPKGFSKALLMTQSTMVKVIVDNIDSDMTDDIQRALPSAIVACANQHNFPNTNVKVSETDLVDHETGFIQYMVASSLVLAAFIISCNLAATAVAREYEKKTAVIFGLAPIHPVWPICGRLLADSLFSLISLLVPVAVVIFFYGINPHYPLELAAVLIVCVLTFSCIGAALGALLKQTMPVASIVFGMALPLFMVSGSYEPERFDGNLIWTIAHLSPIYYGVGVIEHAVHGLIVTPEPVAFDFLVLVLWGLCFLGIVTATVRQRS